MSRFVFDRLWFEQPESLELWSNDESIARGLPGTVFHGICDWNMTNSLRKVIVSLVMYDKISGILSHDMQNAFELYNQPHAAHSILLEIWQFNVVNPHQVIVHLHGEGAVGKGNCGKYVQGQGGVAILWMCTSIGESNPRVHEIWGVDRAARSVFGRMHSCFIVGIDVQNGVFYE